MLIAGAEPSYALEGFSFSREYAYVDDTRLYRVLGEVTNNSDQAATDIVVTASFYDSNGALIGTSGRAAELHLLGPGGSSPFEISLLDQEASSRVANFTLAATSVPAAGPKESKLEIISSNSRLDLLGTLYINAVARNKGQVEATNTIMIATLYDKNDRVVALGRALAEAEQGTSNIPSNSSGPFGIVVTDKLQTYKAVKYSLVAQSDQYASNVLFYAIGGPGQSSGGNQTQSGCLIATAAFGSTFAPQVQQLRAFRDAIALRTFAGSSFMGAFNAWYYSFSPSVAEYERNSPWAREAVRVAVMPLLIILDVSTYFHDSLKFTGLDPESSVVAAGLAAASLVGLVYLSPVAISVGISRRRVLDFKIAKIMLLAFWAGSIAITSIASTIQSSQAMEIGTAMLVISSACTPVILVSDRIARL